MLFHEYKILQIPTKFMKLLKFSTVLDECDILSIIGHSCPITWSCPFLTSNSYISDNDTPSSVCKLVESETVRVISDLSSVIHFK